MTHFYKLGLLLVVHLSAVAMACDTDRMWRRVPATQIEIRERVSSPAYYLRGTRDEVMFFEPSDLITELQSRLERAKQMELNYAATNAKVAQENIETQLPLQVNTDLFKYWLSDPELAPELQFVVAELLRKGMVAIRRWDRLDQPRSKKHISLRETKTENGEVVARLFCSADGVPLFKIIYIVE